MHSFYYQAGKLLCENVSVESLAKKYGTPLYVYSQETLEDHYGDLKKALLPLDHMICYAMKANSNQGVLRTMANCGSGFDTVSGGEIKRVLSAGGDPARCVFAGVGKTEEEIRYALEVGIYSFNVESEPELQRINKVARRMGVKAPVAVRVNPNVDAGTHAKITTGTYDNKFGIAFEEIPEVYARAAKLKHIKLLGLQMHIGSQLTEVGPFEKAVGKVAPLARELVERYGIEFLSIGGGIGIVYEGALASGKKSWWTRGPGKEVLTPARYAKILKPLLKPLGLKILIEPGRFIAGNSGILVTKVEYVKRTGAKNFVIVDSAMNDLIRPAMYESYHEIVPVNSVKGAEISTDVVGPICETGDRFCKDRLLPKVDEGDYLALLSAGAYGFVMASTYNTRGLAAEVLVSGRKHALVRERQKVEEIWAGETAPKWLT